MIALIAVFILIVLVGLIVIINIQYEGLKILRQFRDDLVYTKSESEKNAKAPTKSIPIKQPSEEESVEKEPEDTQDDEEEDDKRSYQHWEAKAANNNILIPGYKTMTGISLQARKGDIVRLKQNKEEAYAELIKLIEIKEGTARPYKWICQILPIEAYSAVQRAQGENYMVWKSKELREKYSYVDEEEYTNRYDLKFGG